MKLKIMGRLKILMHKMKATQLITIIIIITSEITKNKYILTLVLIVESKKIRGKLNWLYLKY